MFFDFNLHIDVISYKNNESILFLSLIHILLHNLEHYNLFLPLDYTLPAWLQTIDKYAWDTMFFLFAGKAYATFSLLFGFSFYIQFHNCLLYTSAIEHRSPHQHKGDNLGAERYCLVFPEIADIWTEVPVIQQPVI